MKISKTVIKDTLEILEAIVTILMALIAFWGTFKAWESGMLNKTKIVIEHLHKKAVDELNKS